MQASEALKQWDDAVAGAEPLLVIAAARELFESFWDGEGGKAQEILERLQNRKNGDEGTSVVNGAASREWVMINLQELSIDEQKQAASTPDSEASPDRRDSHKEQGGEEQEELHDACSEDQGKDEGSNLSASLSTLAIVGANLAEHEQLAIVDADVAEHEPTKSSSDDAQTTNPLVKSGLSTSFLTDTGCDSTTTPTIPELVQALGSGDAVLEATKSLRKLLSIEVNPPISDVISAGAVPLLVEQLRGDDNVALQFEAAWALTNIASGTTDHVVELIKHGVVPIFVSLLRSPKLDVKEQAVWALGNIAGDSTDHRDYVLQNGALDPTLEILAQSGKLSLQRNATWMLSNLVRGKPCVSTTVAEKALPTIARMIHSNDNEVLTDALWALSYVTDGCNLKIQKGIDAGVVPKTLELLLHKAPSVQTPALRTIGNIATGSDAQTQTLLNTGVLTCSLLSLLQHSKRGIRKEACWTISNITAGTKEQVQAVIDGQLIPPLLSALQNSEFEIKKEALWAISNALSSGTPEQANYMANQGCVKALCSMLPAREPRVLTTTLTGIAALLEAGAQLAAQMGLDANPYVEMLEEADAVAALNLLLEHDEPDVRDSVQSILRNHIEA